jgi:hypothetical protein
MAKAKYYPPANTKAQNFASAFVGSAMSPNCLVLHTTEGTSWPSYSGGAVAPHLTALPDFTNKRLVWRQHFPVTMSARALVNRDGGVQTNTANCIQIELVGTSGWASSENKYADYHLGDEWYWAKHATDWMLRDVAAFIRWCHTEWGIPYSAPYAFDDWRGNHSHRMSNAQWRAFEGVCGHSHVPENSHTDPGAFPIARVLAMAAGGTDTNPNELELTVSQFSDLTKRLQGMQEQTHHDIGVVQTKLAKMDAVKNPRTGKRWTLKDAIWSIWYYTLENRDRLSALEKKVK